MLILIEFFVVSFVSCVVFYVWCYLKWYDIFVEGLFVVVGYMIGGCFVWVIEFNVVIILFDGLFEEWCDVFFVVVLYCIVYNIFEVLFEVVIMLELKE